MREMRGAGIVTVSYVPTNENSADLFTKVLSRQPFEKHRKRVLNLPACVDSGCTAPSAAAPARAA